RRPPVRPGVVDQHLHRFLPLPHRLGQPSAPRLRRQVRRHGPAPPPPPPRTDDSAAATAPAPPAPPADSSVAARSHASAFRELTYTRAPPSTSPRAIINPTPRLPPVPPAVSPPP